MSLCGDPLRTSGIRAYGRKNSNEFNVPGWNDRAKELHQLVRQATFFWEAAGRPRGGHLAVRMRATKAKFRREMRFLRNNEENLRSQALLRKLQNGECRNLWKEIRSVNPCKDSLPLSVDNVSGEENIANLWRAGFRVIANSVNINANEAFVTERVANVGEHDDAVSVERAEVYH